MPIMPTSGVSKKARMRQCYRIENKYTMLRKYILQDTWWTDYVKVLHEK